MTMARTPRQRGRGAGRAGTRKIPPRLGDDARTGIRRPRPRPGARPMPPLPARSRPFPSLPAGSVGLPSPREGARRFNVRVVGKPPARGATGVKPPLRRPGPATRQRPPATRGRMTAPRRGPASRSRLRMGGR